MNRQQAWHQGWPVTKEAKPHRRFNLVRHEDETGVSGTGVVAQGVQFASGKVVMNWTTDHTSTTVFDGIDEVEAIHGHSGKTEVVWVD